MNDESVHTVERSSAKNLLSTSYKKVISLSKNNVPPILKKKSVLPGIVLLLIIIVFIIINSISSDNLNIPTYSAKKGNFLVSITESGELRAKKLSFHLCSKNTWYSKNSLSCP